MTTLNPPTESWKIRLDRWRINLFPAYRATGARITYIAEDYRHLKLTLPLNWKNRNHNNSIFGGSLYATVDPIHTLMLLKHLGADDYLGWTKSAEVRFLKPAYENLYAEFIITDEDLQNVQQSISEKGKFVHTFPIELVNKEGVPHAAFEITVYLRKKVTSARKK